MKSRRPTTRGTPAAGDAAATGIGKSDGDAHRLAQRTWRWCVVATWRDYQHSRRAGRPISRPNLMRLFERRWRDAALRSSVTSTTDGWAALGRALIARGYSRGRLPRRTPPA